MTSEPTEHWANFESRRRVLSFPQFGKQFHFTIDWSKSSEKSLKAIRIDLLAALVKYRNRMNAEAPNEVLALIAIQTAKEDGIVAQQVEVVDIPKVHARAHFVNPTPPHSDPYSYPDLEKIWNESKASLSEK